MEIKLLRPADRLTARRSIVVGAVAAVLLLLAGVVLATVTKAQWTAQSVSVVLPGTDLGASDTASYYETLSRGQIVATFAEVAGNKRFEQQAEQNLGLDARQQAAVSSEVTVAPATAVVLVTVTSDDRGVAEGVAREMTSVSQTYLQSLARPYRLEVVDDGSGTAYRSSTSPLVVLAAALVVALVGGLAIQQAVYHGLVALRAGRRRPVREAVGPAADGPADDGDAEDAGTTAAPDEVLVTRKPSWD